MNSLQIEYFLALCKHMNFTLTANHLYVSQPAISKQIACLEKELGMPLFDRTYRDLKLTESGKIFLNLFQNMNTQYIEALQEARNLYAVNKGSLTVGFLDGWNILRLMPNVSQHIKNKYPGVHVQIERHGFSGLITGLLNDSLDVAVTLSAETENIPNLHKYMIGKVGTKLFYSINHPLTDRENLRLEDFANDTFIIVSKEESHSGITNVITFCQQFGFTPNTSIVPNVESMVAAVETGMGVAIFDALNRIDQNPAFRSLDLPLTHDVVATWKKGNKNSAIKLFVNDLRLAVDQ